MAALVQRGEPFWAVRVQRTNADGTESGRWQELEAKGKTQAIAAVARLQLAPGETAPLSTVCKRDNTSVFLVYNLGGKQRWRKIAGVTDKDDPKAIKKKLEAEEKLALDPPEDPFPRNAAEPASPPEPMSEVLARWGDSLTNRNAQGDRALVRNHLVPRFGEMLPGQVDHFVVVKWLDALKNEKDPRKILSSQTRRHLLSALSRFFNWLAARERGIDNPVRKITKENRPVVKHRKRAWLDDEAMVPKLMAALAARKGHSQLALMFALGNRSGLRLGEIAGLRMSDLDHLAKGYITASHSYAGPLKEASEESAVHQKTIPAPVNAAKLLGPHLRQRRAAGAGPDDPVFLAPLPAWTRTMRRRAWAGYTKEAINYHWRQACAAVGLVAADGKTPLVTWYGGTRHTAASRAKKAGLSPAEIAESMGHSGTEMVERFYFGEGTKKVDFNPKLRLAIPALKKKAS